MDELLLAYYGDDFTGSTDCMEALSLSGLDTVLFLEPPNFELLNRRFPHIKCYGIAGISRSMSPAEMEMELTPIFEKMKEIPTQIIHYKICSTFDSSPEVGSIGFAIELGKKAFQINEMIPLVVGAPILKRYTVFGNHFATVKGETFRLDRHPVMARHPITPMKESDLRIHLGNQTMEKIGLMDLLELDGPEEDVMRRFQEKLDSDASVLLFDVLDDRRLKVVGDLMWGQRKNHRGFLVGSSGIEYALTASWKENGVIEDATPKIFPPGAVDQLLVLSGSCSQVTEGQIKWAESRGFKLLRMPINTFVNDAESANELRNRLLEEALEHLNQGYSVIVFSAMGPNDHSIDEVQTLLVSQGKAVTKTGEIIGKEMGQFARHLILHTNLQRIVIAGGDTSGYVTRELGIYGLQMLVPIAPGSPLCVAYSNEARFDGLQVALKAGQVGKEDYFEKVQLGGN